MAALFLICSAVALVLHITRWQAGGGEKKKPQGAGLKARRYVGIFYGGPKRDEWWR